MPSTGTIFAVIIASVVLLVGGAIGLLYLYPGANHSTSSSPNQASSSSHSTGSSSGNSNSTNSQHYSLQLAQSGSQAVLSSTLTTPQSKQILRGDAPQDCSPKPCGYSYIYVDNGVSWVVDGDIEPGTAWLSANTTGFTLTDQTCSGPGNPLNVCGPYWEWNGDRTFVNGHLVGEENSSEVSAVLDNKIPSGAQVFSVYLTLPYYNFDGCEYNVSSTGCSYEGYGPSIEGLSALDVLTSNSNSYSVAVGLAEFCSQLSSPFGTCISPSNQISVGISTAAIVGGQYDSSLSKNLPVSEAILPYSPTHKVTIATDFHSYFDIWVDNTLEYTNSTAPITGQGQLGLNLYQFDNVDNMTLSTTWSNMTIYSSSQITVTGLSSGMTVTALASGGFNSTATANSSGVATLDVSNEPVNLTIRIELNGQMIATYSPVNAGAVLKLVSG
jgi:hypothetical protein